MELFHQHIAVDISLDAGFNVHVPRFALTGKIEFVYFGPNDEIENFEQKTTSKVISQDVCVSRFKRIIQLAALLLVH